MVPPFAVPLQFRCPGLEEIDLPLFERNKARHVWEQVQLFVAFTYGLLFMSALINTSAPCLANCDCRAFQSFPSASITWSRILSAAVSPPFSKMYAWALLARSWNFFSLSPSSGVFKSSSYKVRGGRM